MKRVHELMEEMRPMKEEAKRRALDYILDSVKNANNYTIPFVDEDGEPFGGMNVFVTYDGGRHPEYAANPYSIVKSVYMKDGKLYVDCEDCDEFSFDRLEWGDIIDIADYIYRIIENSYDYIDTEDVVKFLEENGANLFGRFNKDIGKLIADDVLKEYNEAGDGDLQKAIAYVIGDKFGMFEEYK